MAPEDAQIKEPHFQSQQPLNCPLPTSLSTTGKTTQTIPHSKESASTYFKVAMSLIACRSQCRFSCVQGFKLRHALHINETPFINLRL